MRDKPNEQIRTYGCATISVPHAAYAALRDAGLIVTCGAANVLTKRPRRYTKREQAARVARIIARYSAERAADYLAACDRYFARGPF